MHELKQTQAMWFICSLEQAWFWFNNGVKQK